jgi:hypothetical protein
MSIRLIVLAVCASLATPVARAETPVAQLVKDRADAAERVFQHVVTAWKTQREKIEVVYTWSVRWLDAMVDRDPRARKQAFADHLARMQDIETEASKLQTAGTVTVLEAVAATYYRIDAELWAARGKRGPL